jgi:aspartyl-tRNA(Asn)/glutamyl-tRNA(Gln) amidotransferase subunit A
VRTLTEQVAAVAERRVSPTELVEAALHAVEAVEDRTNAFTTVLPDDAMERAKALEAGGLTGPLHGVPIAVKDLFDVTGVVTSGACAAYLDRVATRDSAVVERLRAAGAIVVAKTNMHELAFGTTSQVSCYGPVRNPWDTTRIPAGSSGGSGAAVAAGAVLMAMGSDTGGSIRLPSSMCGVTGLKPTHGAVSLRGALPMTASFDTAGPLAVSAEDCLLVFRAIAGFDVDYLYARNGTQLPIKPIDQVRIALPLRWLDTTHVATREGVLEAAKVLEGLGCSVTEIEGFDPIGRRDDLSPVLVGEFAHHFRDLWDDGRVSEPIAALMAAGRNIEAVDYARGREASLDVKMRFVRDMAEVDALLVPSAPYPAPRAAEVDNLLDAIKSTVCTLPVNAAGLPSVAFPVGFSDEGLPVGAQLIGAEWSEELLCSVVGAFQRETDHHLRRAPED